MSGGSTTWSSTEITVANGSAFSGSGRNVTCSRRPRDPPKSSELARSSSDIPMAEVYASVENFGFAGEELADRAVPVRVGSDPVQQRLQLGAGPAGSGRSSAPACSASSVKRHMRSNVTAR